MVRALGETRAKELDAVRANGCGELTREAFDRLICREPLAIPARRPNSPAPPLRHGC